MLLSFRLECPKTYFLWHSLCRSLLLPHHQVVPPPTFSISPPAFWDHRKGRDQNTITFMRDLGTTSFFAVVIIISTVLFLTAFLNVPTIQPAWTATEHQADTFMELLTMSTPVPGGRCSTQSNTLQPYVNSQSSYEIILLGNQVLTVRNGHFNNELLSLSLTEAA